MSSIEELNALNSGDGGFAHIVRADIRSDDDE